jgi:hypothetical protein
VHDINTDNCFQLTEDVQEQVGAVWGTTPFSITESFEITAEIYLGEKDHDGADGLAFVIQNELGYDQALHRGGGIGYMGLSEYFAVEVDTFWNTGIASDIEEDHIYARSKMMGYTDAVALTNGQVEDGLMHDFKVAYVLNDSLTVSLDNAVIYTASNVDIQAQFVGGTTTAYFGFTAATGHLSNVHKVCNIDFGGPAPDTPAPAVPDVPVPVTAAPVPATAAPVPATPAPVPATPAPVPVTAAPVPAATDSPTAAPTFQSVESLFCENFAVHANTAVTFGGDLTKRSIITGGDLGSWTGITGSDTNLDLTDGVIIGGIGVQPADVTGASRAFGARKVTRHTEMMVPKGDAKVLPAANTGIGDGYNGGFYTPGNYRSDSTFIFPLSDPIITLDGGNDPDAKWNFHALTSMTTCEGCEVRLINGAKAENVLWTFGAALTLGADSTIQGSVTAGTSITMGEGSEIHGCALAQTTVVFSLGGTVHTNLGYEKR